MSEADERALIAEVTEVIKKHEGKQPGGWMSPGAHPSALTEDLLAEAGHRYTLDWPMDDQPVWMKTRNGPLLSVPYPHESMLILHHGTSTAFDMAIDQFDEMLAQSDKQPLALGITIHSFIVGQPFRPRQFRRVLERIARRNRFGSRHPPRSRSTMSVSFHRKNKNERDIFDLERNAHLNGGNGAGISFRGL
jgi:allantoinase